MPPTSPPDLPSDLCADITLSPECSDILGPGTPWCRGKRAEDYVNWEIARPPFGDLRPAPGGSLGPTNWCAEGLTLGHLELREHYGVTCVGCGATGAIQPSMAMRHGLNSGHWTCKLCGTWHRVFLDVETNEAVSTRYELDACDAPVLG